jgi:glycosyltransferase involved in cell wall biosynthesis
MAVRSKAMEADRAGRPYDIVNVHEPCAAPVLLGRRTTSPLVVVTTHGIERRAWALAKEEGALGREGPGWRTRLTYPASALWHCDLALRRADHVFCLNEEDRHMLVEDFRRSPDTITRVMPGSDEIYERTARGRGYTRIKQILFAATWRKNKGIEDLVPAFVSLAERHPDLSLNVVGAGAPEHMIRHCFPESVRSRVTCETPADDAAMASTFSRADLFLLPSLFEGTPLTMMQAMMSGLPIVTTATCGMKDVIDDEMTGLLIPIRSPDAIVTAIERLLNSPALRRSLGVAARAVALKRYTWDQAAAPVLHAYQALR